MCYTILITCTVKFVCRNFVRVELSIFYALNLVNKVFSRSSYLFRYLSAIDLFSKKCSRCYTKLRTLLAELGLPIICDWFQRKETKKGVKC